MFYETSRHCLSSLVVVMLINLSSIDSKKTLSHLGFVQLIDSHFNLANHVPVFLANLLAKHMIYFKNYCLSLNITSIFPHIPFLKSNESKILIHTL